MKNRTKLVKTKMRERKRDYKRKFEFVFTFKIVTSAAAAFSTQVIREMVIVSEKK